MKILYIAHYFPPSGGAGVQRTTKFIKNLPKHGIQAIVLTGSQTIDHRWSPVDDSLLKDLPNLLKVYRTESATKETFGKERVQNSITKGRQAIVENRPDLILVSVSPFSDLEVARRLSNEFSLPWVADLRDPWALDEFQIHKSSFHRVQALKKMDAALSSAQAIIMNTPVAKERLLSHFPHFRDKRVASITNGFDETDFSESTPNRKGEKFRIVHTGAFHTRIGLHQKKNRLVYRMLGRVENGVKLLPRSAFYFIKALEAIPQKDHEILNDIEVVFAGSLTKEDKEVVQGSPIASNIKISGYVDHPTSIRLLHSADLLFLPLHECPQQRASIVPGKTYEYLASGRTILGALPAGDAKEFLEASGNSIVTEPSNIEGMKDAILKSYRKWKTNTLPRTRNRDFLLHFERGTLTLQLADLLRETVADAASCDRAHLNTRSA